MASKWFDSICKVELPYEYTSISELESEFNQCASAKITNENLADFDGSMDDCLDLLFGQLQVALELVFGEDTNPGYICGVEDSVVNDGGSMPGYCCLDAPYELGGGDWGYEVRSAIKFILCTMFLL